MKRISIIILVVLLHPAAGNANSPGGGMTPSTCQALYKRLEDEARGTRFEQDARQLPYLHVDAFLETFRDELSDEKKMKRWLSLAETGGMVRYWNLLGEILHLEPSDPRHLDLMRNVVECGKVHLATDLANEDGRSEVLAEQESESPAFMFLLKLLARLAFWVRPSVAAEVLPNDRHVANIPPDSLVLWKPELKRLQIGARHRKESIEALDQQVAQAGTDELGIPKVTMGLKQALLGEHAPHLLVETRTAADAPGHPRALTSDARVPWEYHWMFADMDFVRAFDRTLIRLIYTVWFGGPSEGVLRGLTWRVTLWQDGQPLIYESIEADGANYEAYAARVLPTAPTPILELRNSWAAGQVIYGPPTLLIAAGNNRLLRVRVDPPQAKGVRSESIEVVTSVRDLLQAPLVNTHGVLGELCMDRSIWYWAAGVRSPGCARNWSNLTIANGGGIQYDDPRLPEFLLGSKLLSQLP